LGPPRKRRAGIPIAIGAFITSLAAAAPAGANVISPEPAHSPQAEEITTLYWIGLVVVAALVVAVHAALLFAIRRYRSERGTEPRQVRSGRGLQLRAGGALGLLALALLVVSVVFTERAREVPPSGPDGLRASGALLAQRSLKPTSEEERPLEITATGQQWLWRYAYPNDAFSYYRLVVPVDTTVVLRLLSTDVVHTWYVPELAGKFDAVPGKLNKVVFRANQEGTYEGASATYSGQGYAAMRTEVEAVPPEEYRAYLERLADDIRTAQEQVAEEIVGRSGG
jgi:cytochrome c oxidase subunit 2